MILTEMDFKVEMRLLTDSSAARAMCYRLGHTQKTKHLEIRTLFLQQMVQKKKLVVNKIDTSKNKADVGTKHFDSERLEFLRKLLGRAKHLSELFDENGEKVKELCMIEQVVDPVEECECACSKWNPVTFLAGMLFLLMVQWVYYKLKRAAQWVNSLFCTSTAAAVKSPSEQRAPAVRVSTQNEKPEDVAATKEREAVLEMLMELKRDELVGLCRGHQLMVTGTKSELAVRLADMKRK